MHWVLRRYPLIIFSLCILAVTGGLLKEAIHWGNPLHRVGAGMLACYLLWLFMESRIAVSSSSQANATTDRGTVQLYGAARVVTVAAACYVPTDWPEYRPWMPVLLLLFISGVVLRLSAIRYLGKFYSHKVRTVEGHQVIQTGPYRWVRHPAYSGMVVAHASLVLLFLNTVSAAALVVLFLPSIMVRIKVEERALITIPGYAQYAARRRRLIPFVW